MKTKTILTQIPIPKRLQGTDGVRREIKLAKDSECRKQTPQQTFLEKGWITEEFMELYAYCFVKKLNKKKQKLYKTRTIIIGWDPRDSSGLFTKSVIRGVLKAGAPALRTPRITLFVNRPEESLGSQPMMMVLVLYSFCFFLFNFFTKQ